MARAPYQRRIVAWLLDHRVVVTVVVCLATLVLVAPLRDPQVLYQKFDSETHEDAEGEELKEFARTFDDGELMMAVVKADDVFTPAVLSYVRSTTDAAAGVAGVRRVVSLTTVQEVAYADDATTARPLFPEIPTDPETLSRKKAIVLSNPLWVNNLVSPDTTVTVINIFLPPLVRGSSDASRIVEEVRELLSAGKPAEAQVLLTGLSPMFVDSRRCAQQDLKRFFWLTWLLMATLLFLAFRTLRGVLLPLGVTFLSVLWTLGLMAATGQALTAVGAMLPTLIAVVCFSDAIHVLAHYYEQASGGGPRRAVLLDTMEHMITACFLTSITTAAAFGSLVVAKVPSVRQFGVWAAVGIMLGYLLNMALMPTVLSWLPLPGPRAQRRYRHSLCGYLLARAVDLSRNGRWSVPATAAVLTVLSVMAVTRLRVETSIASFLPASAPAMQGLTIVQDKLTGFGSVEVVLEGPEGCFEEPWALKELRKIEAYLEARPEVGVALTVADLLQWTHSIIEETDSDLLSDPYARGLVAEYLFLYSGLGQTELLTTLMTEDGATARICARLGVAGTGEQLALTDDLEAFVPGCLDERLTYRVTGDAGRIAQQSASVIRSLLDSFVYTLLVICVMMLWHLRSLKAALLAMVPNVLPVLLTVGVMGAVGISLNFATVMITSIAIGIAVDDTIHFLVRYRRELRTDPDRHQAIENTILHSGRAMAFTSVAMAAGCGLFVLSDFAPNRCFGVLMAFTMVTALVADLLVLPYLIKACKL